MIILTVAALAALFVAYRRYYGSATVIMTEEIIDMDCVGELLFWTGEPVPWAICRYHVCLAIWGNDSDERCDNSDEPDCDGWFQ